MKTNITYLGDCLEVMSTFPDNFIDMVFCDLPYGITRNVWDTIIPLDKLWTEYNRVVKIDGAILLMAQAPFDKILACSNLSMFKYEWIWEKNKATGHLNAKKMPMKAHENVLVFYRNLPIYNAQKTEGHKPMNRVLPKNDIPAPEVIRNYGHMDKRQGNEGTQTWRWPRDVIKFPVINNDNPLKWHPTQKPVELVEYFIKTYTKKKDIVLDNTMGSGSTCVACINTGRQYIGIEMFEEYYIKANNWISSELGLTKYCKDS
jgi:site-specific DNA-methyltransferase (adenine-specific)